MFESSRGVLVETIKINRSSPCYRSSIFMITIISIVISGCANLSPRTVIDLTHPIPTYQSLADNPVRPDLNKPLTDVKPYPIYGEQAVLWLRQIPTNHGHIESGRVTLWEHQGTHMDAPSHFLNNSSSLEPGQSPSDTRFKAHNIEASRLVGPVVMLDISHRVNQELRKNGGVPSADKNVTNFSESSSAVVTADDIISIAPKLTDGSWLVVNLGWSQFFTLEPSVPKSPYINGFNHPGFSRKAIDRLVDEIDRRGVKLSGIVIDNIAVETGQVAHGDDDKRTNALHGHVRLLQRGILLVENATNLEKLSSASRSGACLIVVGAIRLGNGTGAPARVIGMCQ